MKALVLGATGFVGGHIARQAAAAGMAVRALRRRPGAVGAIDDLAVEWQSGDLADLDSLDRAMRGCDVVFHAAGYYARNNHAIRPAMQQAGREMRAVLEAAARAGVGRLIYTSSLSTIARPPAGEKRLADERDVYLPGSAPSAYYEAKWVMECEAQRAAARGFPVVILIPTAIYGPGDVKPTTGEVIVKVARGALPVGFDVETNVVDVRDVAAAHLRAVEIGAPGERTVIGGHNMTITESLRIMAREAGKREPVLSLSRPAAIRLIALARMLRLPVADLLYGIEHFGPVSGQKGWETLGFTPRPFEETVREALAWFRAHGYLPG